MTNSLDEDSSSVSTESFDRASGGSVRSVSITRPRALSHGVEFALVGPSYACHFVNTMTGFIRVDARAMVDGNASPESVRAEILAVHPYWGTFRPVLKPLRFGGTRSGFRERTAFCYTSAEELSAHYVDLVRGV